MGCSSSKTVERKRSIQPITSTDLDHGGLLPAPFSDQAEHVADVQKRNIDVQKRNIDVQKLKIEDTFWKEKKKLIPNYERMKELDNYALEASASLKNSPTELVSYLTKIAQNDLEKFRLLFRWEAQNVDYDVEGYYGNKGLGQGDYSAEGVLKSGVAVCEGYSGLFKMLCDLAGLECESLSGASKGGDYQPGDAFKMENGKIKTDHAWNKIKINGKWYLCDCTWAAGSVGLDKEIGKMAYTRKWNEYYFISDPEMFASKHFPIDKGSGQGAPNEQYLKKPFSDLNVWSDVPMRDCAYYAFNMQTLSHNQGVIETNENEISVKVQCPYTQNLRFWTRLTDLNEKNTIPRAGRKHSNHVISYRNGDTVTCKVRFPHAGDFTLIVGVTPNNTSEDMKSMSQWVLSYTIKSRGNTPSAAFPSGAAYDIWGANDEFHIKGFRVIGQEEPIIVSNTGKAELELQLPDERQQLLAELISFSGGQYEVEGHVCGEKTNKKVKYHVILPYEGEYRFTVMAKLRDDGNYWHGANFMIRNSKAAVIDEKFPHSRSLWGPGEEFYKLDVKYSGSSKIIATDGSCQIKFSKNSDVVFLFHLEKNGEKYSEATKFVFADSATDGSEFIFHARLPEKGYYKFKLFAKNRNVEGSYSGVGHWLLEAHAPWKGEFYPSANGSWGATNHFIDLGLQLVEHKSSVIVANNGTCVITIKAPEPITTTPYLLKNDSRLPEEEKKNCLTITSNDTSISYSIKLPESGFYKLELYGTRKGATSLPHVGCWLIDSKK
ncbi:kyphoscoliosis peptidase-like isoform X2 [Ptychodera flava]|uniref:kyphoscoliosis peptidase-like isoform X2 n=1 Tax=Ptychodera flava TaxID=63121 RepID=UPI003969D544